MKPGIYTATELSNDQYHADAESVSQSGLKRLDQSPAHYRAYADGLTGGSQSAGQFIGTAVHAASLEPEAFDQQYVVAPEKFKARNAAGFKAWKEEQDPRQTILMHYETDKVYRMRDALHRHPWVGPRLRGAQCEMSCFADDPVTGVRCRVRFDMISEGGMILDLKKTQDARDGAVAKAIANYGYYIQNAMYIDVPSWLGEDYRPEGFAFVFIEEEAPHGVSVRYLDPQDVERGRLEYQRLLKIYADCVARDVWPGYSDRPAMVSLPNWARYQIDNREES